MVGRESFFLSATAGAPDGEVLAAFLKQYYAGAAFIPPEILVKTLPEDAEAIAAWLGSMRGGRVSLHVPRRGEKRHLVEMVKKNAALFLEEERLRQERDRESGEGALAELQRALGLFAPPHRIECYDISNIQGRQAVGSMVVFRAGKPAKDQYRKFRIRGVPGPDDYAMMREVLERRFRRGLAEDAAFVEMPDLIVIDGGRGQLSAALAVLRELGLEAVPAFGLAKEHEWLFAPDRPDPIVLPRDSRALHLVQRLRDEAHRFAVGYHRRLRSKASLRSILEEIPGIGPRRRKALLTRFRSLEAIANASVEELAALPGMNRAAAEEVLAYLHGERAPEGR